MRRRVLAGLAMSTLLGSLTIAGLALTSHAAATFDVLNASGYATADHVSLGNDAFPNFATGAVDNRYPLAFARVDLSSAQGLASPLDSGPIGQTGAAGAGVAQPQYANAKYPPAGPTKTVGAAGGPYGMARAKDGDGFAEATAAGAPADAPMRRSAANLRAALDEWRSRFLTADDGVRHPFVTASEPDGADGLTGFTHTLFDDRAGVLTVVADGRVQRAAFGGGAIVLKSIHMHVEITNSGTPKHVIQADIGSAEVGGMPVRIGADGVTVDTTQVPGVSSAADQANQSLNAALAGAGFKVFALKPAITTGDHVQSIEATAVRVRWEGGDVAPGVPRSFAEHDLGEAFAFSLATPSAALGSLPVVGGVSGGGPQSHFVPGTGGRPGSPGVTGTTPTETTRGGGKMAYGASSRRASSKPLWLLLMYLGWQASIAGTATSLWWWRAEART